MITRGKRAFTHTTIIVVNEDYINVLVVAVTVVYQDCRSAYGGQQ